MESLERRSCRRRAVRPLRFLYSFCENEGRKTKQRRSQAFTCREVHGSCGLRPQSKPGCAGFGRGPVAAPRGRGTDYRGGKEKPDLLSKVPNLDSFSEIFRN